MKKARGGPARHSARVAGPPPLHEPTFQRTRNIKSIRARLAALAAGYLLALLSTSGLAEISPELSSQVHAWVEHGFELLFLLGYAVIHPWLQKRWNPTGAYTGEAARRLEHVAGVQP